MKYWSYPEWKHNQVAATNDRNNTNAWTQTHKKKADTSLFTYIDKKVQFIVRQYKEGVNINLNALGFENF